MKEKWRDILKKYRFAALVALAGGVLMLLPGKKDSMPDAETAEGETFSLEETERRMAEVLGAMDRWDRARPLWAVSPPAACSPAPARPPCWQYMRRSCPL